MPDGYNTGSGGMSYCNQTLFLSRRVGSGDKTTFVIVSGMELGQQQWSWTETEVSSPYRESPSLSLQCPSLAPG